jgi:transposase
METISKIRRLYHKDKLSIRAISFKLNLNRRPVAKYLNSTEAPAYKRTADKKHYPRLGEYLAELNQRLYHEQSQPKSQHMTARRHYEWLKSKGYEGRYEAVNTYIRQFKQAQPHSPEVFIPQHYPIGDAYQFDWSTETVKIGGHIVKAQVAHFRLCHSRCFFVCAYPNQKMEMLIDAHNCAFAYWNGVPKRGIYDNMKTAVKRIGVGKEREFNEQFLVMMNHYMIEPVACTPASGWEKGQVERQVQTLRKQVFEPMLSFATWNDFNAYLADMCHRHIQTLAHPEDKSSTVAQCFALEQTHLTSCAVYEGLRVEWVRVNTLSLVAYDGHKYSVPCDWVGRNVALHISATHIRIIADGTELAVHPRSFDKQHTTYNPWHYLPALKRKPGALRNGEPFLHWPLPKPIKQIQTHLLKQPKGDKAMVKLLTLIAEYGEELGVMAAEIALEEGMPTVAAVLNIIHRLTEPVIPKIETYDVPLRLPPLAHLSRYDTLLKQGVTHEAR